MRGKASGKVWKRKRHRITPAYAGKSCREETELCRVRDHPRLCGEKKRCKILLFNNLGSPPPMRGKGQIWHIYRLVPRITPAYAGKRPKIH